MGIGISVALADASHPDELIKRADVALYRADQEGGDCFPFLRAGYGTAPGPPRMLGVSGGPARRETPGRLREQGGYKHRL
jgi:hypothetical protein